MKYSESSPDLQGCHSAQPGSRLMTPSARKGEGPIKYVSGAGGGWARLLRTAVGVPASESAPSLGLLRPSSRQPALGFWGRCRPSQRRGSCGLSGRSTGWRGEAWPCLEPAVWP